MNYLKNITLILIAFCLVLFDVAFMSNFQFFGANLLLSAAFLLVFSLFDIQPMRFYVFTFSIVFFFAILSSLPLYVILINFLILPLLLNFFRRRFFPEPTLLTLSVFSIPYFILFGLVILLSEGEFNTAIFKIIISFIVFNQFMSMFVVALFLTTRKRRLLQINFVRKA